MLKKGDHVVGGRPGFEVSGTVVGRRNGRRSGSGEDAVLVRWDFADSGVDEMHEDEIRPERGSNGRR
ncbi:hypothetical protein [Frankia sp. Cj3]|uniref:hypothetical protein n=1 Tax=Frankia sp. Cj3 TaxID=2880976 RepID=UPI001EF643A0|nr:hypothetical protein [Frankia sp. Cj3]